MERRIQKKRQTKKRKRLDRKKLENLRYSYCREGEGENRSGTKSKKWAQWKKKREGNVGNKGATPLGEKKNWCVGSFGSPLQTAKDGWKGAALVSNCHENQHFKGAAERKKASVSAKIPSNLGE